MPRSLPWFNNNIDSLLPNGNNYSIQPYLYKWDDYQTYDIVTWDKVGIPIISCITLLYRPYHQLL